MDGTKLLALNMPGNNASWSLDTAMRLQKQIPVDLTWADEKSCAYWAGENEVLNVLAAYFSLQP